MIQPIQVSSQSSINIQKFPSLTRVAGWPSGLRRWGKGSMKDEVVGSNLGQGVKHNTLVF